MWRRYWATHRCILFAERALLDQAGDVVLPGCRRLRRVVGLVRGERSARLHRDARLAACLRHGELDLLLAVDVEHVLQLLLQLLVILCRLPQQLLHVAVRLLLLRVLGARCGRGQLVQIRVVGPVAASRGRLLLLLLVLLHLIA